MHVKVINRGEEELLRGILVLYFLEKLENCGTCIIKFLLVELVLQLNNFIIVKKVFLYF